MTANNNDFTLQNYIKLSDVVNGANARLKELNPTVNNAKGNLEFRKLSSEQKRLYAFESLIATGYKVICLENEKELITANFDFASNNKAVLLDFNTELLRNLLYKKGSKQEILM